MHTEDTFPDSDYQRLADFRYALRRFLQFSERAALKEGLLPIHHQALLTIRGQENGDVTLNIIAERLCMPIDDASELVDEMVKDGLLTTEACHSALDSLSYKLTEKSTMQLIHLSVAHRRELQHRGPEFLDLVGSLGK